MAKEIALNRKDHGIQFATKIDPVSGQVVHSLLFIDGADTIAQKIKIKLKTFLGEWFLDRTVGIPYFQKILIRNPRTSIISSILRNAILDVKGVSRIEEFEMNYEASTGKLTVNYSAATTEGRVSGSELLDIVR